MVILNNEQLSIIHPMITAQALTVIDVSQAG